MPFDSGDPRLERHGTATPSSPRPSAAPCCRTSVTRRCPSNTEQHRAAAQRLASHTDREREVATATGAGASVAEIAASLFKSEAAVKAHVTRLLSKLDLGNRVQIATLVHDASHA